MIKTKQFVGAALSVGFVFSAPLVIVNFFVVDHTVSFQLFYVFALVEQITYATN